MQGAMQQWQRDRARARAVHDKGQHVAKGQCMAKGQRVAKRWQVARGR